MISLTNKKGLEHHFAENFDTPIFPVLADLYFNESDMKRARKVCDIGLKHHPDSIEGRYILSKIELVDNNMLQAEKHLKMIIEHSELHILAMKLLIEVQDELGRSVKTIHPIVERILHILPGDIECLSWLNSNQEELLKPEAPDHIGLKNKDNAEEPTDPDQSHESIGINRRIATLTLARVFKVQNNYQQALDVLDIVEEKGGNIVEIEKERNEIQEQLKEEENSE